MSRVIIPIATLYSLYPEIFDGFYSVGVDKDELIKHFILSFGDMTPVYQNPSMLKMHIASTARSLKWSIDHLWHITELEYNPIENYDRQEHWEDSANGTFDKGKVDTSQTYQKGTETSTLGSGQTDTHKVAAFNSSNAELASVDERQQNGQNSTSYGVDTSNGSEEHGQDKSASESTHEGRVHGNIGVTTSQKMIESEIDLCKYNYMDKVCELYAERLLIGVW